MKKLLALLLAICSLSAVAQEKISEGVATMKITMSTDNEQASAAFEMMGDMTAKIYFKGQKSRTEQSHQMTGDNTTIVDNDSQKMMTLLNNPMLGKKYKESKIEVSEEDLEKVSVEETGDSKTIQGYECKGYNVSMTQDGVAVKMKMYVTDKIITPTQNTALMGGKIKGFPMYLILDASQGGIDMQITMEIVEMNKEKVDDKKFDMTVPEGYTEM